MESFLSTEIVANRLFSESIRTALKGLDPRFTNELTSIRVVSSKELFNISRGHHLYFRQGSVLFINADQLASVSPRLRATVVRQAIGQKVWAENKSIQSAFGKMFRADKSLLRLGSTSQEAFINAFSRMNGSLSRQIGFARYYGDADRLIRAGTGMVKLSEQQRAFYQLMKTGRMLGADIRVSTDHAVTVYRTALSNISKTFGMPAPSVSASELEGMIKASRSSMLRTFNNRLASHIDSLSKGMIARGEAVKAATCRRGMVLCNPGFAHPAYELPFNSTQGVDRLLLAVLHKTRKCDPRQPNPLSEVALNSSRPGQHCLVQLQVFIT
ncbi:MAG: hypothetical protein FJ012_00220 [Chloroflexi bacterium]|nr:hypothetical protein [Chloroflexota bacterium]